MLPILSLNRTRDCNGNEDIQAHPCFLDLYLTNSLWSNSDSFCNNCNQHVLPDQVFPLNRISSSIFLVQSLEGINADSSCHWFLEVPKGSAMSISCIFATRSAESNANFAPLLKVTRLDLLMRLYQNGMSLQKTRVVIRI